MVSFLHLNFKITIIKACKCVTYVGRVCLDILSIKCGLLILSHFLGIMNANESDFLGLLWVLLLLLSALFFEESPKVNGIDQPALVALRPDEFGVT